MNCKRGDLALVIAGPSTGLAVTCLEALPAGWWRDDLPAKLRMRGARQQIEPAVGPLWRVERLIEWGWATPEGQKLGLPGSVCVVPDYALLPIRPEPDKDDLPAKVPADSEAA